VAAAARSRIQSIASAGPGVLRDGDGLAADAARLAAVRTDAHEASDVVAQPQAAEWETTNVHQVATALTAAAALRTESRGGHFRTDFPASDPAWERRVLVSLGADGTLLVR
ncbi:MAG: L-aspartate oxidase, partial [Cellulosimicrobium funkei]